MEYYFEAYKAGEILKATKKQKRTFDKKPLRENIK